MMSFNLEQPNKQTNHITKISTDEIELQKNKNSRKQVTNVFNRRNQVIKKTPTDEIKYRFRTWNGAIPKLHYSLKLKFIKEP